MPSIKNGNADEEMDEIVVVVLPVSTFTQPGIDSFSHGVRAFSAIRLGISINNIEDLSFLLVRPRRLACSKLRVPP